MRNFYSLYLMIISAWLLSGCVSNTSVSSNWHDRSPTKGYDKVLVVAMASDSDKRLSFEDILATKLSSNATEAIPSSRYTPTDKTMDDAAIANALRETGAKAAIVTQVTNFDVKPVNLSAYTDISARRRKGTAFQYDYIEKELPEVMSAEFTIAVTTDVYTVLSSTTGQESLSDVIGVLSDLISQRLKADRVIQ